MSFCHRDCDFSTWCLIVGLFFVLINQFSVYLKFPGSEILSFISSPTHLPTNLPTSSGKFRKCRPRRKLFFPRTLFLVLVGMLRKDILFFYLIFGSVFLANSVMYCSPCTFGNFLVIIMSLSNMLTTIKHVSKRVKRSHRNHGASFWPESTKWSARQTWALLVVWVAGGGDGRAKQKGCIPCNILRGPTCSPAI